MSNSATDFGSEAIAELMSSMNDQDPVMIFAGYAKDMDEFMGSNVGLLRRFGYAFDFANYAEEDIAKIFFLKLRKSGFKVSGEIDARRLGFLISANTDAAQRATMNGGMAAQLLTKARRNLDRRLPIDCPDEDLVTLTQDDLIGALRDMPEVPQEVLDQLTLDGGGAAGGGGGEGKA